MVLAGGADAADIDNRLTYLDQFCDPYHVGLILAAIPKWSIVMR